jgi:Tol biopolymer transport system component
MWTPDGKRIAYRATRTGFRNVFWTAADGTGEEERLTTSENMQTPGSWSPDGTWLAFNDSSPTSGLDLWVLRPESDRTPQVFLKTPSNERNPRFSPDGRWLAYESNESGRFQICVRPFPGPGGTSQISTEGGTEPVWSRDGRELFYLNGDKMMAVDIVTRPALAPGSPRLLFEGRYETSVTFTSSYDVSLDGRRFLRAQPTEPVQAATQIQAVINWSEELKQRVPAK